MNDLKPLVNIVAFNPHTLPCSNNRPATSEQSAASCHCIYTFNLNNKIYANESWRMVREIDLIAPYLCCMVAEVDGVVTVMVFWLFCIRMNTKPRVI